MSNSAAPRESDAARRHAQDTLAINKVASGWIGRDRVLVAQAAASTASVRLAAASEPHDAAVLVLPVDEDRFLTVEWLAATGLNSFLPHDGVAVTLVDLSEPSCATSDWCGSSEQSRTHISVSGSPPFTDLLTAEDELWVGYGWTVRVDAATPGLVHATHSG